jgi:hypothetical protein
MDVLDILTPELNANHISELKQRLRSALKQAKINKSQFDPRIVNLPLPNDAVITYDNGARAYKSDIYQGFIWRNGVWYLDDVKFKEETIENSICDYNTGTIYSNIVTSLVGLNIDDTFYPCIINGQRIFIHENWNDRCPIDVFIFEPSSQQIFRSTASLCRTMTKKFEYEDEKSMKGIPISYMPIKFKN